MPSSTTHDIELEDIHQRASTESKSFDFSIYDEDESTLAQNNNRDSGNLNSEVISEDGLISPVSIDYKGTQVILETKNFRYSWKLKIQIITSFLAFLTLGLMDQAIGSIMEYILTDYKINRIEVSNLFLFQFVGYVISSLLNNYLQTKVGLRGVIIPALLLTSLYAFLFSIKSPMIVLIIASSLDGFGVGSLDCSFNLFIGNLKYSNQILGLMHSFYGLGCFISPIFSIYLINRGMPWNKYYLIIFLVIATCTLLSAFLFRNETAAKYNYVLNMHKNDDDEDDNDESHSLLNVLKNSSIQFFSLTLFVYVGSELSVGVWLFNYILNIKQLSEKKASYITSTYWFFMTFGRFTLAFVTGHFFENNEIQAMTIFTSLVSINCLIFFVFQKWLWVQVVSISVAGFCVGPIFATTVIIAIKVLPKGLSAGGVSIICGIGAAGAAVVPYLIGFIAEKFGNGNDGRGLVYFPFIVFLLFTSCAVLWGVYYYRLAQKGTYNRIQT